MVPGTLAAEWRRPHDRISTRDAWAAPSGHLDLGLFARSARTGGRAARVRDPGPCRPRLADHAAGPDRGGPAGSAAVAHRDRPRADGRPGGLETALAASRPALVHADRGRGHRDRPRHVPGVLRDDAAALALALRHALAPGVDPPAGGRHVGARGHLRGRAQLLPVALPLDLRVDPGDDAGQPERCPACGRRRRCPGRLARDLAAHPRARGVVGSRDLGGGPAHGHRRLRLDLAARARGGHAPERRRPRPVSRRSRAVQRAQPGARRRPPADPARPGPVLDAARAVAARPRPRPRPEGLPVARRSGHVVRVPGRPAGGRLLRGVDDRPCDPGPRARGLAGGGCRGGRRGGVARAAGGGLSPLPRVRLDHERPPGQSDHPRGDHRARACCSRWGSRAPPG